MIYNADFLANDIPSESVDLIVTDPPYKIGGVAVRPSKAAYLTSG